MVTPIDTFWSGSLDTLLRVLSSSPRGLTDAEAHRRLAHYGRNRLEPVRRNAAFRSMAAQLTSPVTALLLVAATLSLGLGERTDGLIVLGILLASGALGAWQEHRATDAVNQLLTLIRTYTSGLRVDEARVVAAHSHVNPCTGRITQQDRPGMETRRNVSA